MPSSLYFGDRDKPLVVEQSIEVVRQGLHQGQRVLDLVEYQGTRVVVNAASIAFVKSESHLGPVVPKLS
jgi:hypothetical protein